MTQSEKILQHISFIGGISAAEAMDEYGCMRLAARIADLRSMGISIRREWETKKNRYGEPVTYARYYLEEKKS